MNLRDYLSILRDYWKSILVVTVAGVLVAIGAVWVTSQSSAYVARASVLLTVAKGDTALEVVGGADYAITQAQTFGRLAELDVVLAPVVKKLGLQLSPTELEPSVMTWNDGAVVQIQVSYPDAQGSAAIAQAIAEQLVPSVERLSPVDQAGHPVLVAEVVSPAGPAKPADPPLSPKSMIALGLLAGLVLGLSQAAFRKVLSLSSAAKH